MKDRFVLPKELKIQKTSKRKSSWDPDCGLTGKKTTLNPHCLPSDTLVQSRADMLFSKYSLADVLLLVRFHVPVVWSKDSGYV
ncbi:hypothetical protein Y1Q_0015570 [Alligator mississippiensis]|uniref:Uncharacterized protein n=1 Tax=Alligator mississippiensis TaxID=8496 RepID=A0A151NN90_ALLMI|nr:hypothetical protein Y1Q_0015570 [Alligator mississippiensis]